MRERFIADLVKELLGPRNGAVEQFPSNEDPRNEYLTGQLIPPQMVLERAPEEDEALAGNIGDPGEETEEETPLTLVNQAMIDSGQNFRRIPSSMGISFVLSTPPAKGDIKVCITWARYRLTSPSGWGRQPNFWIHVFEGEEKEDSYVSPTHDLSLTYKINRLRNGYTKVSIYLSSAITSADGQRIGSDLIIFQPELRILLRVPETLMELGDLGFMTNDPEWRLSTRQYDKYRVFARGHLCGAYWKAIDPQRSFGNVSVVSPSRPFTWIDGLHFLPSTPELAAFFEPDVRTDFIPIYPAPASEPSDWKPKVELPSVPASNAGGQATETPTPVLRADLLAKCTCPQQLELALMPLVDLYEKWIGDLQPDPGAGSPDLEIVNRHNEASKRIRNGIDFLIRDPEAYRSFLFMNKAMALQYSWGRKSEEGLMEWKPFQLAFILLALTSTVLPSSAERKICDTIWFPTGGGKTEAYLGLAAFALAYRRRVSAEGADGSKGGEGTCVISRYTLRLLTIQQFRRALKMVTACEILRCQTEPDDKFGWWPRSEEQPQGMSWGRTPFSIGLWVGSKVTPNSLDGVRRNSFGTDGALHLLAMPANQEDSDPAQIVQCPVCSCHLSLPIDGIHKGDFALNTIITSDQRPRTDASVREALRDRRFEVLEIDYRRHQSGRCGYLKFRFKLTETVSLRDVERWWNEKAQPFLGVTNCSLNITRPGYFAIQSKRGKDIDYEIRCPNGECELNQNLFRYQKPKDSDSWDWAEIHPYFQNPDEKTAGFGIPINAHTVDAKLYRAPPSMLVSTCDKFAMAAFMNDSACIFGRVRSYGEKGYSQERAGPQSRRFTVPAFEPPSLIIQDELHLLEGPLGSSFGIYETVIEKLCNAPKYIASSATIRNSTEQISALMGREGKVFPPVSLDVSSGFFLKLKECHPLDETLPGRLFLGLAFPGRAPQTPMLRTWARLLQTAQDLRNEGASEADLDYFWTLIGYFNAVRELAQVETLLRQDVPQYLDKLQAQTPSKPRRELVDGVRNLSSQTDSSELPGILAQMERTISQGDTLNTVAATSMFGTGVDVARLSMMIVHGQPKSASQYIQAVGRIGRKHAGLAVVFFRVSKPRDLNHYEYFTGYHRKLAVAVEPITVKPLAPKALDRSLGGLLAMLVRNWQNEQIPLPLNIDAEENAALFSQVSKEFLQELRGCFKEKWQQQPPERRPADLQRFLDEVQSKYERWVEFARRQSEAGLPLRYSTGEGTVLLGGGDQAPCVFSNVPKSLREVEPMISIYTRDD